MSVESYIRALPKFELNLRLEGAVPRETMLMFANQNELSDEVKRFDQWLALYEQPDPKRLDELGEMLCSWLRYGDDLTRAVYDLGVRLSKDNVRYAEVGVNPLRFVSNEFTFDAFLDALNDGRSRAERAWGIQMRWAMIVPRSDPRRADEVALWATSSTAKKNGVVALTLAGYDKLKSVDQFERAFQKASKKGIASTAYLNEKDDVHDAINLLDLDTVVDGWGVADSPEIMATMREKDVSLNIGVNRAAFYGWIDTAADYPLNALRAADVPVVVGTDMPALFRNSLSDEYLTLMENNLMTVEGIEQILRQTLEQCHLPDDEKEALEAVLMVEMDVLQAEHLVEDEPTD